ncbi:hypothetical protein [Sphingomonas nostoxanthinifaciens]|uniref:hypothetical protein n=1 Tax=Sphingomonas nostoxanthinifaciens TaxID=2872652 RepID=UPI001CC1CF03|nr:hypothetical protein [Sphingomonas nostoxanthinifaciens]UAK23188.1 hypothetical protein K8P63_12280 [Sphingomonas nostoxanthinifaciens]
MISNPSTPLRWHSFEAPPATETLALIICEAGSLPHARSFAAHWASLVPGCAFAGLETNLAYRQIAFAPVRELVEHETKRLGLDPLQIVLIGFGMAGQRALDLALCNVLGNVSAIIVDLPPDGVVVGLPPAQGAFRFVQHHRDADPDGRFFEELIHTLRRSAIDIRTMILPVGVGATDRAIQTFLVELVARASRYHAVERSGHGVSSRAGDRA